MKILASHFCACFFLLFMASAGQAMPVEYLRLPTLGEDLPQNINRNDFSEALKNWVNAYNRLLNNCKKLDEKEVVKELTSYNDNSPLNSLDDSEFCQRLEIIVRPVLENWREKNLFGNDKDFTPNDANVLKILKKVGLVPETAVGEPYLMTSNVFKRSRFEFSPKAANWFKTIRDEPQIFADDHALRYPRADFAIWLIKRENFLRANPGNPYAGIIKENYKNMLIDLVLFWDLDNSSLSEDNDKLTREDEAQLKDAAQLAKGTFTGDMIEYFLEKVKVNNDKAPPNLKEDISARIDKEIFGVK